MSWFCRNSCRRSTYAFAMTLTASSGRGPIADAQICTKADDSWLPGVVGGPRKTDSGGPLLVETS